MLKACELPSTFEWDTQIRIYGKFYDWENFTGDNIIYSGYAGSIRFQTPDQSTYRVVGCKIEQNILVVLIEP